MLFDSWSLISSKNLYFWWFINLYYLKKTHKSQNNSKFNKEQEVLHNIDSIKTGWLWAKMGVSQGHIGLLISEKIQTYILTRAELLFTLCYEIHCTTTYWKLKKHRIKTFYKKGKENDRTHSLRCLTPCQPHTQWCRNRGGQEGHCTVVGLTSEPMA